LEKLDKKLKKMALILYAKSISQKGFKMTDTFMQDGDSCVFSDFIYRLPFYITEKNDELFVVQSFMYSQFKRYLKKEIKLVFGLMDEINKEQQIISDAGIYFESVFYLNLMKYYFIFEKYKFQQVKEFDFLQNTSISNCEIKEISHNSFILIPKVTKNADKLIADNIFDLEKQKTILPKNLNNAFKLMFMNGNSFGITRDESSSCEAYQTFIGVTTLLGIKY
jgi:hypothetical protein